MYATDILIKVCSY